jgi:transformer-2 protein
VVYVSNLAKRIRDDDLREKMSKYGKVISMQIVREPFTKDSRGFGFVTFDSAKDAEAVIEGLNKTEFEGRQLTMEISKRNRPHISTPGVYLGPTSATNNRRRYYSPNRSGRRYRSRSRDRDRDRDRERDYRSYKRQRYVIFFL